MTADEIRKTAEALHDQAMDPAKFRGLVFNLAAEAVAQLAPVAERLSEIAGQQSAMLTCLSDLADAQTLVSCLAEAQSDPQRQAAQQVAVMSGIQEVVALWNREHPLQAMRLERKPQPSGIQGVSRG